MNNGAYNIIVTYTGEDIDYSSSSAQAKITVNKLSTKIVASKYHDTNSIGYRIMCPRINTISVLVNEIEVGSAGNYSITFYKYSSCFKLA